MVRLLARHTGHRQGPQDGVPDASAWCCEVLRGPGDGSARLLVAVPACVTRPASALHACLRSEEEISQDTMRARYFNPYEAVE